MPRQPLSTDLEKALLRFGEAVATQRKAKGLTQEKLAELAGLHPRVVQKIEHGLTNVLVTTAMRLKSALQCEWGDLMPK